MRYNPKVFRRTRRNYQMDKKSYRTRNWSDYNKALVQRGSITFWFDAKCIAAWQNTEKTGKRGRPQKYNDAAIHCGLMFKALFKLTFRATMGFIKSLMEMLKLKLDAPDYTLLCKRQKDISTLLPSTGKKSEKLNIVVDTTGLKVYGEGEWKVRQHGWVKHRLWRKLHLAVNSGSHEIEAFELTDLGIQDCEGLSMLIDKIPSSIKSCKGDGAYDSFSCYEKSQQRNFKLITPPARNAVTSDENRKSKKKASAGAVKKRDDAITRVRQVGRKQWKIETKYHRRSLAETAMFRVKQLLGNHLSTRKFENQKVEMGMWCQILNKMTKLGMPKTIAMN